MAEVSREQLLAGYAAWNLGELDAWLEFMHPDVVLHTPGIFPGFDPTYRGHDGLRRFWRQLHEPWEDFTIDIEWVDEEPDAFVVAIRFRARGAGSGVDVDMQFGHAVRVNEDGLVTAIVARGSAEEARDALRALP